MKVRISGNKIRYRLKEPEVKQFHEKGTIEEMLEFGMEKNDRLKFTLARTNSDELSVQFSLNEIIIFIPEALAEKWTSTELVGFDAVVDTGKGKVISILVEKDFVCMDGREEDNVGSYPNPMTNSK